MPGTVVLSSPRWHLSGVNTFNARLTEGLQRLGYNVEVLLTDESVDTCAELARTSGLPLHTLPVRPEASWPQRWRALIEFLSVRGPCVYFPGYDFDAASVCPALPPNVGVIGVWHSDEPVYDRFVHRLASSWNGLVGVSRFLAGAATRDFPQLAKRIRHIPYGVDIPPTLANSRPHGGPLRCVIVGRLWHHQKRVLDLIPLGAELEQRGAAVEITVVGGGHDEIQLRKSCARYIDSGRMRFAGNLPNPAVLDLLPTQDVILLLSEFEGLPLVLLEAMGRGCIPVVTDIRSGIPDVITHGVNGCRLPVGQMAPFAAALDELQRDGARRRAYSNAAYDAVAQGGYRVADMARSYAELIELVLEEARTNRSPGRSHRIAPPRHLRAWPRWRSAFTRRVKRALLPGMQNTP